jgi:hypothetical protein
VSHDDVMLIVEALHGIGWCIFGIALMLAALLIGSKVK